MSDLSFASLTAGKPVKIEKDGRSICVARVGDQVFAIDDTCSHSDASLSEGDITDFKIECWLHGAEFDLRTGEALTPPAVAPIKVYSVIVDGDSVTVEALLGNSMSTLEIRGLKVSVDTENGAVEILKGVDLTIKSGETHAIMGPNGSGKSTLAYSIAGHPKYNITGGTVTLDGADVLEMTVDERAKAGLFLAMQYPVEVPGVSVSNFLRTAATALRGEAPKLRTWVGEVKDAMQALSMDPSFAQRNVNEGFSGGEKKRHEIMQLELLKPKIAILDETDSGLDVDALRIVSEGVNRAKESNNIGVVLITHYTRILRYIKPDFVHVFANGKIVEEGGPELADKLEANGYAEYVTA
jgi:Fe-S cluster assembly ATP-binding protein